MMTLPIMTEFNEDFTLLAMDASKRFQRRSDQIVEKISIQQYFHVFEISLLQISSEKQRIPLALVCFNFFVCSGIDTLQ
jgi:hypothetical protein